MALLSSLVALALAIALPGSALASSLAYTIKVHDCAAANEQGWGYVYMQVKLTEFGSSGANKLTLAGWAQHRAASAASWRNAYYMGTFTSTFKDDGANHSFTRWFEHHPADYARHRIKAVLKAWHGATVLFSRTIYSEAC
jgi:hypothetical protein